MSDKYKLPFEIAQGDKKENVISSGLKRVEIFVRPHRVDYIIKAIKDLGFEATVYDSKGFGEAKDQLRAGRGGKLVDLTYSSRSTIISIVNSDKLHDLLDVIKKVSESKGEHVGVIGISPMDALIHL